MLIRPRLLLAFALSAATACSPRPHELDVRPSSATPAPVAATPAAVPLAADSTSLSCDYDYAGRTDVPIRSLEDQELANGAARCAPENMFHLYYRGRIDMAFAELIERFSEQADRHGIRVRVVDIDSPGGDVDAGMRAGDAMANGEWAIWVKPRAHCHSACVFVLAGAGSRSVGGAVGIHRLIPVRSAAQTVADLDAELKDVSERVRAYFRKHGVHTGLVDEMMVVPASEVRVLTEREQEQFGLGETNAAQSDLDRIKLIRKCGQDFVDRKERFISAWTAQCMNPDSKKQDVLPCGRTLLPQFGFPDKTCIEESPMFGIP